MGRGALQEDERSDICNNSGTQPLNYLTVHNITTLKTVYILYLLTYSIKHYLIISHVNRVI